MKKSNYNTFFKVNEQEYVFNAMTCSCAKIDNSFKKNLENLGICPYGFIPEEWGIEKLDNPINLILNKK